MKECINSQTLFRGKIYNFISLYRSPSQSFELFKDFADNLELNLDKIANKSPYLIVVIGDFNVKSSNWCKYNKTTYEGSKIDITTSQFGLEQLIKGPTHILTDSFSSIDLLFTFQPNPSTQSTI